MLSRASCLLLLSACAGMKSAGGSRTSCRCCCRRFIMTAHALMTEEAFLNLSHNNKGFSQFERNLLSPVFRPSSSGDVLDVWKHAGEGNGQLLLLCADNLQVETQTAQEPHLSFPLTVLDVTHFSKVVCPNFYQLESNIRILAAWKQIRLSFNL